MKKEKLLRLKKPLLWAGKFLTVFILFFSLLFLLTSFGAFGKLPTTEQLKNPRLNLASEIISSDGVTLGKFAEENRTPVKFKDISESLVNALIATEDERFYNHSGIDFRSTMRAVCKPGSGGASTITQQLAKNLFTEDVSKNFLKRVVQKMKEWVVAVRLEEEHSKEDIITMYLNTQDFVFNAVGIRSASRIYFGKEPNELDVEEAAVIVAMLKNPVLYNPNIEKFKQNCLERRNVVFKQMARNNFITEKVKDSLQKLPLRIDYTPETHYTGNATYFRSHLQKYMSEWAKDYEKRYGKKIDIYKDGLKIHVTLNSKMQQYAEEAVVEHMNNLQNHFNIEQERNRKAPFYNLTNSEIEKIINSAKENSKRYKKLKKRGKSSAEIDSIFLEKTKMTVFTYSGEKDTLMSPIDSIKYYKSFLRSGLLSVEPQTGHIKAWVGGVNFKFFKYDAVEQQKRQVGSTFKPFVYATAINKLGLSPCHAFLNEPFTIEKGRNGADEDWTPANANNNYGGLMNLKTALAKSVNVISAKLIDTVTPRSVVELAHRAGIKSYIPKVPSIALGSVDLTLLEMVNAYATFANKGQRIDPVIITKIEDKNGRVLQRFTPVKKKVMSEQSAYIVLDLLKGVVDRGSGARLRSNWTSSQKLATGFPYNFKNPIAGKTGTTQNQSDGWFIGIVPNLVTGVWTGGEDRAIHFRSISKGQGASMSLPSWALYMKKCYEDDTLNISSEDFVKPSYLSINLNCPEIFNVSNEIETIQLKSNIFDDAPNQKLEF